MKQDLVIRVVMLGVRTEEKQLASMVEINPAFFCFDAEQNPYQCSECVYSTAVELDWFKHQQSPVRAAYYFERNKLDGCLSLIIPYPFEGIVTEATIDGRKIKFEPLDMSYKHLYEVAAIFSPIDRRPGFSSLVTKDAAAVLDLYLERLQKRPNARINQQLLALRWFSKATGEYNPYDRFMSFWIAFDALCSYGSPRSSKQRAIEYYVGRLSRPRMAKRYYASFQSYIQKLATMNLVLRRPKGPKQVSADLSALLSTRRLDYLKIIKEAALGLYAIRNNLFHGDYRFGDEEHTDVVSVGEKLLCGLLQHLFALLILRRQLPTTRTVEEWTFPQ